MMFRASYRNFGNYESILATHTVTAGSSTGMRWYEVRSPNGTPAIFQQGTYAPDANYRWMGSIAQDRMGNVGLGYSISSSTTNPSVAWTGRLAADTLGTMGQGEATIFTGSGSQTGTGNTRWGDYSNM